MSSGLEGLKVGLDVDGVVGDFVRSIFRELKKTGDIPYDCIDDPELVTEWDFGPHYADQFSCFWNKMTESDHNTFLYLMDKLDHPPFMPHAYISARKAPVAVTSAWLKRAKLPKAPIFHTEDKLELIKKLKINVFVDDKPEYFQEINKAGVICLLRDQPYNRYVDAGPYRIKCLDEVEPAINRIFYDNMFMTA